MVLQMGKFLLTSPKQIIWSSTIERRNHHHPPYQLYTINEISLKQVQTKKVLGIVIDENLHLLVTLKTSQ